MIPARYEVGDLIRGDHRVIAIHKGHFGVVYICRQELPGGKRLYKAIKTFRNAGDEYCRGLFDRELANWVQMSAHPNVVQAKDADTVNKLLVLEFIPGPNLRIVASRNPLAPRHFLKWAREMAVGLDFLHRENGFLHRDLRPANILIDAEHGLTAKISDLGIGKHFNPQSTSHTVIGTYTYMAPEVHDKKTDFRSDIFSYGASLYYLLTGRYAVKLTTKDLKKVTSPERFVAVPKAMASLILRCLEKDPTKRFPTMEEVVAKLEPIEEWEIEHLPYGHCDSHDYQFFAGNDEARCPFCKYKEYFEGREAELDELLAKRG